MITITQIRDEVLKLADERPTFNYLSQPVPSPPRGRDDAHTWADRMAKREGRLSMYELITASQILPGMVISFYRTQAHASFLLDPSDVGVLETHEDTVLAVNQYGKLHSGVTQVVVVEGTFYFRDDNVLAQIGEISPEEVDSLTRQRTDRLAREYS